MKKLLLFAAAAAALASCAPKTAPELPMETFFRNSEKTGYQISVSYTHLTLPTSDLV